MQKILFPMQYLNITTGVNMLSHVGTNAIDNAGVNTGIDNVMAPFTGIIKKKWANGNTIWLESVEPVLFADGNVDYAVFEATHDNNINDLFVGQRIEQGQVFYQEGTAGNATGNHVHMELGKGKFTGTGWYQNAQGVWTINNGYAPWKAYFLKDTNIINDRGYAWVKDDDEMPIKDTDHEYNRWASLSKFLRSRTDKNKNIQPLTRDEFRDNAVGMTWLSAIERLMDNEEANETLQTLSLGEWAKQDNWSQQIKDRTAERDDLIGKVTKLEEELKVAQETVTDETELKQIIQNKNDEISQLTQRIKELSETPTPTPSDDNRTFGELLSAAFKKLFNIK